MRRALVLAALALVSCQQTKVPKEKPPVAAEQLTPMPDGHPDIKGLAVLSPAPRRLSLDQIEQSLDNIANLPPGTVKLPADLSVTLGRPDYARVTEENLEPGPLFMKFLQDVAVGACQGIADYDQTRPVADRVMIRFPSVDENISFMLLRWTGIEGPLAATYQTRLRTLYDAAASGPRPLAGYEAVCVGLTTSPEFLLY